MWTACVAAGDVYCRPYRGPYCVRCERFYAGEDLIDGRCPEHDVTPEMVEEDNYFFRLSRYAGRIAELLDTGQLRVVPETRHREVRAFVAKGLAEALRPLLPTTSERIAIQLGAALSAAWKPALAWGGLRDGTRVGEPVPLFARDRGDAQEVLRPPRGSVSGSE